MFGHTAGHGRRTGRRRALAAVLAIGLGAGLLLAAPSAQADTAKPTPSPTPSPTLTLDATPHISGASVRRITVEARLKCDGMSAEAHAYAVDHKYCGANGDAGTDNTKTGLCGTSWIDIFDDIPYDYYGRVEWGMNSFLGVMVYKNLYVNWTFSMANVPVPFIGSLPDTGLIFTPNYVNSGTAVSYPWPSLATAQLVGTVTLIWGGECEILQPQAIAIVS
jgi:hypothetical protein